MFIGFSAGIHELSGPGNSIDKIVELVYLKYMRAKITYEGMQRLERYFVSEEALREALLNALCHKQYQSGVPIRISVYEDKLYIANCGCPPENRTLENLMSKHASSPYNPNIPHVFYLAGFIESWGAALTCPLPFRLFPPGYYHISNREVDMPVAWTKFRGNGRVFYNSLGHHDDVFNKSPEAELLMERGMLWAAEGKRYAKEHGLTTDRFENTTKMY